MIRRITIVAMIVAGVIAAGINTNSTPARAAIGPECRPDVTGNVLSALARNGVSVLPGQEVQYLQVTRKSDGTYFLEPCIVTVPARSV